MLLLAPFGRSAAIISLVRDFVGGEVTGYRREIAYLIFDTLWTDPIDLSGTGILLI